MNSYPELPHVAYHATTVPMMDVVARLQAMDCALEVKRMAYIMFRQESGNGHHGINNNYCGIQADGSRWPSQFDPMFCGVVEVNENGTGRPRLFLAFNHWEDCLAMLVNRVQGRGLYIGAPGIKSEQDLARCYYTQWVTGNPRAVMPKNELEDFLSMYGQAAALFRAKPAVDNRQQASNIPTNTTSGDPADSLNAVEDIEDAEEV